MSQLTFDGREVDWEQAKSVSSHGFPLTELQRELLRRLPITSTEAGVLVHTAREYGRCAMPEVGQCCRYASSDGNEAMKRLMRRGLVRRDRPGLWVQA